MTVHCERMIIRDGLINPTSILWRLAGTAFEAYAQFIEGDGDADNPARHNGATLLAPSAEG